MATPSKHWRELVQEKREQRQQAIPKEWVLPLSPEELSQVDPFEYITQCELLTAQELEITGSEVDVLLEKLAKADWSAVQVTTAFAKRAIIAHQLTNCLTEIFIDRALERAKELDEHLKKTGQVTGPLHGLPISLKDQITIKGMDATMGYVSWIGKHSPENAVIVDILLAAGAVLYVKTNIPQTLMWPETFNHIFGRTINPYNRDLTSGGSSGGEGALVALRGSPIGVGSDVGGSVRIPAAFCGIYGLRPSYGRIPYAKAVNSLEGQDSVLSVFGPLSHSLSGIKMFVKAVVDKKPWLYDPLSIRKPWDEDEYKLVEHGGGQTLCFGILWDDGVVKPAPPVLRGLDMTKKALLKAGHKVVDWKPLKHDEIYKSISAIWGAGSSQDYEMTTSSTKEPIIVSMGPEAEEVDESADRGQDSAASFRAPTSEINAYELWQIQRKKRDLRQEYLDYWRASEEQTGTGRPVDALITPVAPYPPPPHGKNKSADYTMIYNLLDYTAITLPVSRVDPELDVKVPRSEFYGERDRANYDSYDPRLYTNAPISIQLVGQTLEEEAVIAMAEIVDGALRNTDAGKPRL